MWGHLEMFPTCKHLEFSNWNILKCFNMLQLRRKHMSSSSIYFHGAQICEQTSLCVFTRCFNKNTPMMTHSWPHPSPFFFLRGGVGAWLLLLRCQPARFQLLQCQLQPEGLSGEPAVSSCFPAEVVQCEHIHESKGSRRQALPLRLETDQPQALSTCGFGEENEAAGWRAHFPPVGGRWMAPGAKAFLRR